MGRPRVKVIDDNQPSSSAKAPRGGQEDSLVAKLKEELGIEEKPQPEDTSGVNKKERPPEPRAKVKTQKPGKTKSRSKRYIEASKDLDRTKFYPLPEALDMVKKMSYSKFNDGSGTLEAHINTTQTGIRGLVSLPFASGKKIRILAFGKGAENSGADILGDDSMLGEISNGKIDFDILITTPEWMPKLAKVAKYLGPRGLMPNPKNGTITDDLKKTVESFQSGKTEFKTESKAPVIHLGLGKLEQPNEELEANIRILLSTIGKTKVTKVTLSPTMGPGVKLDLSNI
mgnify:CR=1 FL=1